MMSEAPEIDESLLTLEDVAILISAAGDLPAATAGRLARAVRTDPRFEPHVERLDALAGEAGLPAADDRPLSALHCDRSFERLAAATDWRHPAEVLDPDGDRGIAYPELLRLARTRARLPGAPGRYAEVLARLEEAWAEERERAGLVERFVEGLIGYGPQQAERLLRLAASEYRLRVRADSAAAP